MTLPQFFDNPFHIQLSFHKIIERYEEIASRDDGHYSGKATLLLQKLAGRPELRDGITDIAQIKDNEKLISVLLADLFPEILTENEIKAVSIPYQGLIFNYTQRFRNILQDAGPTFEINISDFSEHQFYVASCCLILNRFYGTQLDFTKPLFYDIPTSTGIIKHYRILYNADFLEIIPTENAPVLSDDEVKLLIDNYDDLALWKEKFPKGAWLMKGFAVMTLFDATVENAVSNLKTKLLGNSTGPGFQKNLASIFRSIFKIPDLRIGFTSFDQSESTFRSIPSGTKLRSFLLHDQREERCSLVLGRNAYNALVNEHTYFSVSDMDAYLKIDPESRTAQHFLNQNIQSFILAPVVKNDVLLGILELVSPRKKEFNTVNAHKLEIVMPFLVDTIDRKISEMQNRIRAVIQTNYTTLHPSVYWKFRREAQNFIQQSDAGSGYKLQEIVFEEVYPLYGQIDIKDSSITRNQSVKKDLIVQINRLMLILEQLQPHQPIAEAEQHLSDLQNFLADLSTGVKADTEQQIKHYLETNIYSVIKRGAYEDQQLNNSIEDYFKQTEAFTGEFYTNRRAYETTLTLINEKMVSVLDKRQLEIQPYFPHYYERFKTDGVDHNLYIGSSISPALTFTPTDLRRLRLWQLLVAAELELEQHRLRDALPYRLGVTSLILVFSTPIAIRFRMDEKHFDIDGAYNIRYEVIKKRIDKAHVKGTEERITQKGTIAIVYSNADEEQEYLGYIHILQQNAIVGTDIEHLEVEDLQGVSGLKALRVKVLYEHALLISEGFGYDGFYAGL